MSKTESDIINIKLNRMEKIRGKSLKEWKKYCSKDNVPIKTMKYIICLEERIEALTIQRVSKSF